MEDNIKNKNNPKKEDVPKNEGDPKSEDAHKKKIIPQMITLSPPL